MVKETVEYVDFNEKKKKETLYFNLSKKDFIDLQIKYGENGIDKIIQEAIDNKDYNTIYNFFENIILKSYGKKSEDGSRFVKPSKEQLDEFLETAVYSEFLWQLVTVEGKANKFIEALMKPFGDLQPPATK